MPVGRAIIHVVRSYVAAPPSPGGMERHVNQLCVRQRVLGHAVTQIYSTGDTGRADDVRVLAGWPILHLRPHFVRDLLFYGAATMTALRRGMRADVLHVHGDWSAFLLGAILGCALRARVLVASFHGHLGTGAFRQAMMRLAVRRYRIRYSTGLRESRLLTERTGVDWAWMTSGIAEEFFAPGDARETVYDVVTVASLLPVKNLPLFLSVADRLRQARFAIVGDGPQRAELEKEIRARRMGNVSLLGALHPSTVAEVLRTSRLFLMTSFEEGTPTSMLEAMASGLPIVTTASNDYSELLGRGEGGEVVSGWDPDVVARTVAALLADSERAAAMSAANQQRARDYRWQSVAERLSNLMTAHLGSLVEESA